MSTKSRSPDRRRSAGLSVKRVVDSCVPCRWNSAAKSQALFSTTPTSTSSCVICRSCRWQTVGKRARPSPEFWPRAVVMTRWWTPSRGGRPRGVIGDPLDAGTQIFGLVATARHRNRIEAHIAKGKAEGARLVAGGGRPSSRQRGWYVEPTVFAYVAENATIAQEETPGPVVAILPYHSETRPSGPHREQLRVRLGRCGSGLPTPTARWPWPWRGTANRTVSLNGTLIPSECPVRWLEGQRSRGASRALEGMDNYLQSKSIFLS